MEFQLSYLKSWKMLLWKCFTQYVSTFGKLSSGHRTWKGQFSFQPQRKAMPKNAQTTTQLHSSHRLILKEMGIPDHLSCFLRNLYAGQEATIRTGHGTTDWFQIRKGVRQGCILSLWLFNLYAEYIMWNARLDEAQAGIKIARRNLNNFRYGDDTTLMAESEKELKNFLIKKLA